MAVFYNEPKDGKFATIYVMKYEEIKTQVLFSELRFVKTDDYFHIFAFVEGITDCIKPKDKEWKFEPQLMRFDVARKTVTENKKEREQSRAEKLICYALEELPQEKTYKGHFKYEDSGIVNRILDGVDSSGKALPPEVRNMLAEDLYQFQETELTKFSEADMTVKKQWSSSGSKAQTEAEKLQDRLNFVVNELKKADIIQEYTSVLDLVVAEEKSPDAANWIKVLLGRI